MMGKAWPCGAGGADFEARKLLIADGQAGHLRQPSCIDHASGVQGLAAGECHGMRFEALGARSETDTVSEKSAGGVVKALGQYRVVAGNQHARVARKAHLLLLPAMQHKGREPGPRRHADIGVVKRPGVDAAKPVAFFEKEYA